MLGKSNSFRITNIYMYGYRQNVNGSITSTFSKEKFINLIEIVNNGFSLIDRLDFNKEEKDCLYSFLAYELCIIRAYQNRFKSTLEESDNKKVKELYFLMKYTKNPKVKLVHNLDVLLGYRIVNYMLSKYLRLNR